MEANEELTLEELLEYDDILIQCHDNPDADAIASGFALYSYFVSKNKKVKLGYSGKNVIKKSNLVKMIDILEIPIDYLGLKPSPARELLITVDCQYGAGNVTHIDSKNVVILDHHQSIQTEKCRGIINPKLGSCSTLIWSLLKKTDFDYKSDNKLGTALYYGLYTDTNQFSELIGPLDMDMRDDVFYMKSVIFELKNSNLSLREMKIAGAAINSNVYNDKYRYALIHSEPCDPNILGLISDLFLQVDGVDICLVYNDQNDGYKLSVRSCIREVQACELASFLTEGFGNGGGHSEKAGGYLNKQTYLKQNPYLNIEDYITRRMENYYNSYTVAYAGEYQADLTKMKRYVKNNLPIAFVKSTDLLPEGTPILVRTLEGDANLTINAEHYLMIGIRGEVYPIMREKFEKTYQVLDSKVEMQLDYTPKIRNIIDGENYELMDYAKSCVATGKSSIYAYQLDKSMKIFTKWYQDTYMLGKPGDCFAVREEDHQDIYIVEQKIFNKTYQLDEDA